ncbi:hypothetical protein [Nodosilinea sp. E11]|uniref:hypothetical protein n=1 Tax=Nodosilinea sp. E11 TaxID=3037479 RepID=UPI002934CC41|nr:hypothetical protein [Nodosilinea sp. E11]WOD37312.1 hypothetical protein RRF56_02315 [Nodosilinea sp. E11]
MSNLFGINQSFKNRTPSSSISHYSGPASSQVAALVRRRSRIAAQPLATQAEEVAL